MDDQHRIEAAASGGVHFVLPPAERELLLQLRAELLSLLESAPDDPSLERLFPPAYDDGRRDAEYHRLMDDELMDGRRDDLDVMGVTAGQDKLSPPEADAWLRALTDLRLVLGTRLDVTEDMDLAELDSRGPRAHGLAIYAYLSWLQEQLVEAIAGGLER